MHTLVQIKSSIFVAGPGYVVCIVSITDDSRWNPKRRNDIDINNAQVQVASFVDSHNTSNNNVLLWYSNIFSQTTAHNIVINTVL